jgi:hypothetical protein
MVVVEVGELAAMHLLAPDRAHRLREDPPHHHLGFRPDEVLLLLFLLILLFGVGPVDDEAMSLAG